MPSAGPGQRKDVEVTKASFHGAPAVEQGLPGMIAKSEQAQPAYPSLENALAAQRIAIGETAVIFHTGEVTQAARYFPADVGEGQPLWIRVADNVLVQSAEDFGTNEVQRLTIANATSGTITLTFDGDTTRAIAFNARAADVLAALEELDGIEPGDVIVTGADGGPFTITFTGQFWQTDVPAITVDRTALRGGGTESASISTVTAGEPDAILKYGRVVEVDDVSELVTTNLNARDTF